MGKPSALLCKQLFKIKCIPRRGKGSGQGRGLLQHLHPSFSWDCQSWDLELNFESRDKGNRGGPPCMVGQLTHSTVLGTSLIALYGHRALQPLPPLPYPTALAEALFFLNSSSSAASDSGYVVYLRKAAPEKLLVCSGIHFVHLEINRCIILKVIFF